MTVEGLELTRVTLVDVAGEVISFSLCHQENIIKTVILVYTIYAP